MWLLTKNRPVQELTIIYNINTCSTEPQTMTTESQDLSLMSHPKDGAFYSIVSRHYTGVLGPTQTTGWAPPAGLTNTSSSRNLVFTGGLPSRYWPAQPCLASVGKRSFFFFCMTCMLAYSTWCSPVVSHPSTIQARPCLASEIWWDRACSGWYGCTFWLSNL